MKNRILFCSLAAACCLVAIATAVAKEAEWRGFRGPSGSGAGTSEKLPLDWNVETGTNIAWQKDLPGRGVCGPIIVGGRVIVSASSGQKQNRMHVLAFDEKTGEELWHRKFWATGRTLMHPTSANAAPTPTTDGERVFVFYSSNDLVCLDLEGNLQWMRGLALDHIGVGNDVGMSSSPVVVGDTVVVLCQCQANSFCAGIDRKTGETVWEVPRPSVANWSTPVAIETEVDGEKRPAVVLQSGEKLEVFSSDKGELLWDLPLKCGSIPSTAGSDELLLVPSRGITAVWTGSTSESERTVWSESKLNPGNASPVVLGDQVLVINGAGVLTSASLEDGSVNWRKRLKGPYWASPVAAGTYLYFVNQEGTVQVIDLEDKGAIVTTNNLGKDVEVLGSPAVAGDALYIRGHNKLWKIAEGE